MKKLGAIIATLVLPLSTLQSAGAGPTQGGITSDNVEYVAHVPFQVATATGAKVVGEYLYVTSWREFSIYDVSDPLDPELLSSTPFGFKFENEDVATNGEIMLFSETIPQQILHVWNIEDKTNPVEIATVGDGAGDHTADCILDCKYSYGSEGSVVDLRDPAKAKLIGNFFEGKPGGVSDSHDVNEVSPGIVLTSSRPIVLLDARKDPVKPKLLAVGDDESITGGIHSNQWPNDGKDDFVMFSAETNARTRCDNPAVTPPGGFMTWDGSNWQKTGTLQLIDTYRLENGTYADGRPAANGLGCSAHWFEEHQTFNNGGLVAMGAYEHGTRFIDVGSDGMIKEAGWFVPWGGSTSAAYWLDKRIVYAVDYSRGLDILRWTGKF